MKTCESCGGRLYCGDNPYQIDELVCRDCQRSPAVQVRVLLERARDRLMEFEVAWRWALGEKYERADGLLDFRGGRVRWPHDTTHRVEWKQILGEDDSEVLWRACYLREPADARERQLVNLVAVAVAA